MALHGLTAHENIFRDGKVLTQIDLLKHRGDAHFNGILRTGGNDFLTVQQNFASVHMMNAGQTFDQRGFSCAVFTQQRVNFALVQGKIHFIQRLYAGELNFDPLHFQNGFLRQENSSLGWNYRAVRRSCRPVTEGTLFPQPKGSDLYRPATRRFGGVRTQGPKPLCPW